MIIDWKYYCDKIHFYDLQRIRMANESNSQGWKFRASEYMPGIAAGIVRTAITYPFDSLKTHMQKSQQGNIVSNFIRITKNPAMFYRGSGIIFLTDPLIRGLIYGLMERYKDQYSPYILGFGVGALCSIYTCPMQYITRNSMLSEGKIKIFDPIGCNPIRSNYIRLNKLRQLYTAFPVECPTMSLAYGLNMGTYTFLRESINPADHVKFAPLIGGLASLVSWTAIYPLDQLITDKVTNRHRNVNRSTIQSFKDKYSMRGIRGLYFGIMPVYIRSVLHSAPTMFVYEFVRKNLTKD